MPQATIKTDEIDVRAFNAGIFISDSDMLSPVAVYPQTEIQRLDDFFEEAKRGPREWITYAGPAGIGQYSLKKGAAGVFALFNIFFRNPTDSEMQHDFGAYGEQVMGSPVEEAEEAEKNNPEFEFLGKKYKFIGPPRIVKSVFVTRVFPGDIPSKTAICDFAKEVDAVIETGNTIIPQGYQFLHAKDGTVWYSPLPLAKPEDYDPDGLRIFGKVEIRGRKMTYFPEGNKNGPIDFSGALRENQD